MSGANQAPDMAKQAPLITPLLRAAWADMIANDGRLSANAVRVAIIVGGHFNNYTAETYASQRTIAAKAKISPRTAWDALRCLVGYGHLTKRRRGRLSNIYGMPLKNVEAYCKIYFAKSRSEPRNVPTIYSQIPKPNIAATCEQTLSTNSSTEVSNRPMAQADVWQRALGDLADRYGRDVSDAWFCKLSFVGIRGSICVLRAPTKFIKNWIETHYGHSILEALQSRNAAIASFQVEVT